MFAPNAITWFERYDYARARLAKAGMVPKSAPRLKPSRWVPVPKYSSSLREAYNVLAPSHGWPLR